jgi:hypothetical protein
MDWRARVLGSARVAVVALLLASPAIGIAGAQSPEPPVQKREQGRDRWEHMTDEEKQRVRERFERWKALPQERKDSVRRNFDEWRRMTQEEKATARKNFERWQTLSPEERERLRERWRRWRELPPEKREALREQFRHLSPEEKQTLREKLREGRRNRDDRHKEGEMLRKHSPSVAPVTPQNRDLHRTMRSNDIRSPRQ